MNILKLLKVLFLSINLKKKNLFFVIEHEFKVLICIIKKKKRKKSDDPHSKMQNDTTNMKFDASNMNFGNLKCKSAV